MTFLALLGLIVNYKYFYSTNRILIRSTVFFDLLGTTLSFSKATFYVKENEGPAQPELTLSVPALFDINVVITGVNNLAGKLHIYTYVSYTPV